MLPKHVVLVMWIINIINMDDIRQEKPSKGPIFKFNKKAVSKQDISHTRQERYGL